MCSGPSRTRTPRWRCSGKGCARSWSGAAATGPGWRGSLWRGRPGAPRTLAGNPMRGLPGTRRSPTPARAWRPILGTTLFLLLAVLIVGRSSMGAQRWIPLGPLGGFQPSELAKLALIITLAKHMDGHKELTSWRDILPVLAQAAVPIALVVRQPDLGTSMVLTAIVAVMLFAGGAPLRAMGAMGAGAAAVAPMAWRILHDYQRRRLLV